MGRERAKKQKKKQKKRGDQITGWIYYVKRAL